MHRSRAMWLVAGAVLCLPAAAAWSLQVGAARGATGASQAADVADVATPAAASAEKGFRHGSHLDPAWDQTERKAQYGKHCSVCHVFEKKAPLGFQSVTSHCALCHHSDPSQAGHDGARLELDGGVPPVASRESVYDHSLPGHQERACVDCHTWSPGPRGDFRYPEVKFGMPASLAVCADCHHHGANDPGAKLQKAVHKDGTSAAWRKTWDDATSCADCHKAGTPRLLDRHQRSTERVFEHASHVPPSDLGAASKGESCTGCHTMDRTAAAATMGVEQKSCGECHFADQGATTTRLTSDLQVERMPTTFSHTTKGHQEACSRCHPMANDARDPEVGRMYADCTNTCHTDRRVPRHGSWSCDQCHAGRHPANEDEARALAMTSVQRSATPSLFAFASAQHPGVTATGPIVHPVTNGRVCVDCHRYTPDGLSRALTPRPFSHTGHLQDITATTPTSACTTCHGTITKTSSAQFVHAFQAASAREAQTCTKVCHQSSGLQVVAPEATVQVPLFSHAQHASQPCAVCHVGKDGIANWRDAALVAKAGEPDTFSCARCHGHKDPEKVKVTGGYETTAENNTCFACHVTKQDGEFKKEVRREQRFQLVEQVKQFHAKGGECRACHAYDDPHRPAATTPVRIKAHRNLHASHPVTVGGTTRLLPAVPASKDCTSCHAWQPRRL